MMISTIFLIFSQLKFDFLIFFLSKIWKNMGVTQKKINWIFIISSWIFFWHIEKILDIIIFWNNIQKKNSLGLFNRHRWTLMSQQKIRHKYGFCYRRFSVYNKKNWYHTMIFALYQAYSKICFRNFFKLIIFFSIS